MAFFSFLCGLCIIMFSFFGCQNVSKYQSALPVVPADLDNDSGPSNLPKIIAHRGGAALAPENTMMAFENAVLLGSDQVECDVHMCKDGNLIIMHDADVSRTTNGFGQICELDLNQIKTLNAAAKFGGGIALFQAPPTLNELLIAAKGKIDVQIEIKTQSNGSPYSGIEQKVADLISLNEMIEHVTVISFFSDILCRVKEINPNIKTGYLVNGTIFSQSDETGVFEVIKALRANSRSDYLLVNSSLATEELMSSVYTHFTKVGVWTVNDSVGITEMLGLGFDFITTDRPDIAIKCLLQTK